MADEPDAYPDGPVETDYDPSTVEVNRARQQGLGVGKKDLQYQRDANDGEGDGGFGEGAPSGEGDTLIGDETQGDHFGQAGPPGDADDGLGEDAEDYAERLSGEGPSGGAGG